MKVCKKRQIFFPSPDQKIGSKYLEFHFFRLWSPFFAIWWYLVKSCWRQIFLYLPRQFFWHQAWPYQTPATCFLPFSPLSSSVFSKQNFSEILGELIQHWARFYVFSAKNCGEISSQSWPLSAIFFNFPVVHWLPRTSISHSFSFQS